MSAPSGASGASGASDDASPASGPRGDGEALLGSPRAAARDVGGLDAPSLQLLALGAQLGELGHVFYRRLAHARHLDAVDLLA